MNTTTTQPLIDAALDYISDELPRIVLDGDHSRTEMAILTIALVLIKSKQEDDALRNQMPEPPLPVRRPAAPEADDKLFD